MHVTLGKSSQNAPTVETERIIKWSLGHVYFLGVTLAQKRWVLCLYHTNSKARKQIWILKWLRTLIFLKYEIQAWRQSSFPGPEEEDQRGVTCRCICISAFKQQESILGRSISGWSTDSMWGYGIHGVYRGGGLGKFSPFIFPLERRKVL